MSNLPPELAATLRLTIADERSKLVGAPTETISENAGENQDPIKIEEEEKIFEGKAICFFCCCKS